MTSANDGDLLTIRQMCDRFGVTARALRFYESRELIHPQRHGQQRLYDRRDRARVTLILRGKMFGFSLEQIGALLDLYDSRGGRLAQNRAALAAGRERLEEMIRQREALTLAIDELSARIADIEAQCEAASTPAASIHNPAGEHSLGQS